MFRTKDFFLVMVVTVLLFCIAIVFLPSHDTDEIANESIFPVTTPEAVSIITSSESMDDHEDEERANFIERVRQAYRGPIRTENPEPILPPPVPENPVLVTPPPSSGFPTTTTPQVETIPSATTSDVFSASST